METGGPESNLDAIPPRSHECKLALGVFQQQYVYTLVENQYPLPICILGPLLN
jgi:hypothetical protein